MWITPKIMCREVGQHGDTHTDFHFPQTIGVYVGTFGEKCSTTLCLYIKGIMPSPHIQRPSSEY